MQLVRGAIWPCQLTAHHGVRLLRHGKTGVARNLKADEMTWQVLLVGHDFGCRVDSAIAMGQGEPLANYDRLVTCRRRC